MAFILHNLFSWPYAPWRRVHNRSRPMSRSWVANPHGALDATILATSLCLYATGILFSLGISPAVAERLGLPTWHFVQRHILFATVSCGLMLILSRCSEERLRRICLMASVAGLALLVMTHMWGIENKGSRRWLKVGMTLQVSELIKPMMVVLWAWCLHKAHLAQSPAQETRQGLGGDGIRPDKGGGSGALWLGVAWASYLITCGLLLAQPDFGQTFLINMIWIGMLFVWGAPVKTMAGVALGLMTLGLTAYQTVPYFRLRLTRYWYPSSGDTYQIKRAIQSILQGGMWGRGPGEGIISQNLPDAHTDFVMAAALEEYGFWGFILLMGCYGAIWRRGMRHVLSDHNMNRRLIICGLLICLVGQALISMGVNFHILPTKGLTLPLISLGGSSMVGVGISLGILLAYTTRRSNQRAF